MYHTVNENIDISEELREDNAGKYLIQFALCIPWADAHKMYKLCVVNTEMARNHGTSAARGTRRVV